MPRFPPTSWLAALLLATAAACGSGSGNAPGDEPPSSPTGVAARATGPTGITLSWTAPPGTLTAFEVERATAVAGPFAQVATPPPTAAGFGDAGLTSGVTYSYRVRALSAGGGSPWSEVASATTDAGIVPAAPAAPSGLVAVPQANGSVSLSWADNSSDETGFELQRADGSSALFVTVTTTSAGATGWADSGLAWSSGYAWRVRAVNGAGPSPWSSTVAATTAAQGVPAPPTGVTATQEYAAPNVVIRISWTDAASNETGYEVERSGDQVAWTTTATLPANSSSSIDGTAPGLATSYYRVRAVNGGGASGWATASVYNGPMAIGLLCAQPGAPAASPLSDTSIRVTWGWPSACNQVALERALSAAGPWSEVVRLYAFFNFPPEYDDTGLIPGASYWYRLRTIAPDAAWSSSGYTTTATATTTGSLTPPAPTGLLASVSSATTATLTWTDGSSNEEGFAVEYAMASGGPWSEAFRVGAGVTTAYVNGMTAATAYWVRVRAFKGTALSAPSNVAAFTTASSVALRTTGDAMVVGSTADSSLQARNLPADVNGVGCYFIWTFDALNQIYYWHNCYGSALKFDVSALSGRTILSARLALTPCALAPGPVDDAYYLVRAFAGAWSPSTVTFNSLPQVYVAGSWSFPPPRTFDAQHLDMTAIVTNWASGAWANNGLFVEHYPVNDQRSFSWKDPGQSTATTHDFQDQGTSYCSLEQNGGVPARAPALLVDYR